MAMAVALRAVIAGPGGPEVRKARTGFRVWVPVGVIGVRLALATPAGAGSGYATPRLLVETAELARLREAPGVRIVDVRNGLPGMVGYRGARNDDGPWMERGSTPALPGET